jgi:glycosyltransferase involved in cell wall biosynthesis
MARVRSRLASSRLLVIGDGPARGQLRRLAASQGLDGAVEFTGFLPRAEAERRLESAWVQVVPSLWEEPFGMVAAEAMMRGTALVASAAGGLTETVDDGVTGLLAPPGDPDALAGALLALLEDPSRLESLAASARRTAERRYRQEHHLGAFLEIYERITRP